jgi:nicotinate-nucleotide adenylyltransferase
VRRARRKSLYRSAVCGVSDFLKPRTIAVLAGAFNPLTRAHLALVDAGLQMVDEVICVVPRSYPHKSFEGAGFEDRLSMLDRAKGRYEVAVTEGGLFIEIARELRQSRPEAEIHFLCGRDAAERVLTWDYGKAGAVEQMLKEFGLLVASRQGEFMPPENLRSRIRPLPLAGDFDDHSSTEVRRRVVTGEPWEHLVPEAIVDMVRQIYRVLR